MYLDGMTKMTGCAPRKLGFQTGGTLQAHLDRVTDTVSSRKISTFLQLVGVTVDFDSRSRSFKSLSTVLISFGSISRLEHGQEKETRENLEQIDPGNQKFGMVGKSELAAGICTWRYPSLPPRDPSLDGEIVERITKNWVI